MSATVCLEIPSEVVHATKMTLNELRLELAVHLFQQGKLSFGKAREMAGMTVWAFQQMMGSRGIHLHYDIQDYEQDRRVLRDLGRI